MVERLKDAVTIVTGGGSGIGAATCRRFAEEGASVVAVDWNGEAAEETVTGIGECSDREALAVKCDVGNEAAVRSMAERVAKRFGVVDVLVNNAGIRVDPSPVTEMDESDWDRIMGVNLKGTAFCSKHIIPLMKDGGSIVNVSSVNARLGRKRWGQYDATKGAITSLTRDMACDHASDGIRVNAVSPGWVITDYHLDDRTGEDAARFVEEKTTFGGDDAGALQRAAVPPELANAILFLASEEASFVTGVDLPVDGGKSLGD